MNWVVVDDIDPNANGAFGHWTRVDASNTIQPREANDNLNMGTGNITTTGNVNATNVTASTSVTGSANVNSPLFRNNDALTVQTTANNGIISLTPHGTGVIRCNANTQVRSGNGIRLFKTDNANWVQHSANGSISANTTYTWPSAPGSTLFLRSTSAGALSWSAANNDSYTLTNTTGGNPNVRLTGSGTASGNDDVQIIGGDKISATGATGSITLAASGNWHSLTCAQTGGNNNNPAISLGTTCLVEVR